MSNSSVWVQSEHDEKQNIKAKGTVFQAIKICCDDNAVVPSYLWSRKFWLCKNEEEYFDGYFDRFKHKWRNTIQIKKSIQTRIQRLLPFVSLIQTRVYACI